MHAVAVATRCDSDNPVLGAGGYPKNPCELLTPHSRPPAAAGEEIRDFFPIDLLLLPHGATPALGQANGRTGTRFKEHLNFPTR